MAFNLSYKCFQTNTKQINLVQRDAVKQKYTREIAYGPQQENNGFGCNECNAVYKYSNSLTHHIKLVH